MKELSVSIPPGRAISTGWWLFWTGLWNWIRRRPGVTFTVHGL